MTEELSLKNLHEVTQAIIDLIHIFWFQNLQSLLYLDPKKR